MSDLMWGDTTEKVYDDLIAQSTTDPETGDEFTLEQIDWAIQSAVETVNGREGSRISDLSNPFYWSMVADDVANALGIDYDQMTEVAP